MVSNTQIAERIRELRKSAGMNVDEVGAGVGRSGKTVSAWETGRNVPSADMLIDICRFFGVSIEYFYPEDITYSVIDLHETQPESLTADEKRLLEAFRALDETYRQIAIGAVEGMLATNRRQGDTADTVAV